MTDAPERQSFPARLFSRLFSKSGDYRRRYGKAYGSNSVDYRKNRRALQAGNAPDKLEKLAGIIPGKTVVDVGAGEGILALLLAQTKDKVRAIDVTPRRHDTGKALQQRWGALGKRIDNCEMILGDALNDPSLLAGFDTLVASRVVYYFGADIDRFIRQAAEHVQFICLIGNASRNRRLEHGKVPSDIGDDVVYSTVEGMKTLLERNGFTIRTVVEDGDPVVVAEKNDP